MRGKRIGIALGLSLIGCTDDGSDIARPRAPFANGGFVDAGPAGDAGSSTDAWPMGQILPEEFSALTPAVVQLSGLPSYDEVVPARFSSVQRASRPPPPLSGGTLASSASGRVIASDPDRDQLYVVDATLSAVQTISLEPGQEPGRIATHDERAYVALRAAGQLLTVDLNAARVVASVAVCAAPRGVYFDASGARVLVACAGGDVVSVAADGARVLTKVQVAPDLRDIGRDAQGFWVTQYRAATLLRLDASLRPQAQQRPPDVEAFLENSQVRQFAPTLAWRTIAGPNAEPLMLHQRAQSSPIDLGPAGAGTAFQSPYGGGVGPRPAVFCQSGVVHTALTRFSGTEPPALSPALPEAVVPVDVSVAPDGRLLAVVAPGNFAQDASLLSGSADSRQLFVSAVGALTITDSPRLNEAHCLRAAPRLEHRFPGEATAVHFVDAKTMVVQVREPAELHVLRFDASDQPRLAAVLTLASSSLRDTGHEVFHQNTGTGIACVSCHGEALDDGHTWDFGAAGTRRTQHLRGGVVAHAPFHWSADLYDFTALLRDVYERRMGAIFLPDAARDALQAWLSALPLVPSEPGEVAAVARGRALFESTEVGCATCHAGTALRSDTPRDVGTGGVFKVPSLLGAALRLPLMHNGCADTLQKRFDPACGGSNHGNTSQLSAAQIADLIAYLGSL